MSPQRFYANLYANLYGNALQVSKRRIHRVYRLVLAAAVSKSRA